MAVAQITARVDDNYELYVNGVLVLSGNDWARAQSVVLNLEPGDVIAIRAVDVWGPGGAYVDIALADGTRLGSSSEWRVSNTASANWASDTFDDSAWVNATNYGSAAGDATLPPGTPAQWIWDATNTMAMGPDNDVVYFRYIVPVTTPPPPPPSDTLSYANTVIEARVVDLTAETTAAAARLLLMGDSITMGIEAGRPEADVDGYREDLFRLIIDAGLWVNFVGDYQDGPSSLVDQDHQGLSGIRATEVAAAAGDIAVRMRPDIALILLGTNDALRDGNAASVVPAALAGIIADIHANAPGVDILLAALPPLDPVVYRQFAPGLRADANVLVDQINAQLEGVVAQAVVNGVNVRFVPMPSLSNADLGDGIHPNSTGYAEMAQAWFTTLMSHYTQAGGTFGATPQAISPDVRNVIGSELGDLLRGDGEANTLDGRGGNDRLEGMSGADILQGAAGDDWISGGHGDDVALYAGPRANYQFVQNGNATVTVTDLTGAEGVDTILDIERIGFQNGTDIRLLADVLNVSPPPPPVQTAFGGVPWLVDADGITILAADFDNGGQGVAYNDNTGRQNPQQVSRTDTDVEVVGSGPTSSVGWTRVGEWLEYTINVEEAGTYSFSLLTSTPNNGRTITASFEQGGSVYATSAAVATPNTGAYNNFTSTQTVQVTLQPGEQVVRLTFAGGNDQDVRSFTLTPAGLPSLQGSSQETMSVTFAPDADATVAASLQYTDDYFQFGGSGPMLAREASMAQEASPQALTALAMEADFFDFTDLSASSPDSGEARSDVWMDEQGALQDRPETTSLGSTGLLDYHTSGMIDADVYSKFYGWETLGPEPFTFC